jgi:hypothetical protein
MGFRAEFLAGWENPFLLHHTGNCFFLLCH